jgi:PAS domain S-box-containing protein
VEFVSAPANDQPPKSPRIKSFGSDFLKSSRLSSVIKIQFSSIPFRISRTHPVYSPKPPGKFVKAWVKISKSDMIDTETAQFSENRTAPASAARDNEENYRQLADAMPQIVWTARADGFLDYYNQRWFDYTGMTLEKSVGWGWATVLHPDDLQNCIEVWSRAVETGEKYTVEYRFKRASDGAYRWHLGQALPAHDEAGNVVKWFGTCTDIHEQKQVEAELRQVRAELESRVESRTEALQRANVNLTEQINERVRTVRELRESRRFIESVTENSTSIIYVFDIDRMTNVYTNREVSDFLGYTLEETRAMGENFISSVAHPDDLPFVNERPAKFAGMRDTDVMEFELRLRHHTGEWRWVWFRERIFKRDADGSPRQIMGTAQDVTERRRIKQALKEATKRERAIIENALDVICSVDAKGRFVTINPACFKIWGYTPEELLGRRCIGFVLPEDRAKTHEIAVRIVSGEEITNFENRCRHKNGAVVDTVWTAHWSPSEQLMFAVARDATDRKRAEAGLEKERKFLDAVLANMTDGLVACNAEGELTLLNRASQELHGLPAEALAADDWAKHYDLYRADGRTPLAKEEIPLFRALHGETVTDAEMVVAPKSRPPRALLASGQAIFDAHGQKIGAVVGMRDITERKRAENRTQVIFEIIQGAATTSNLDELLALVHQSIARTIYAENFYVALYDKSSEMLHIPFFADKYDVTPPPQKLGRGLTAYVMHCGRPMLLTESDIRVLVERGAIELGGTPPAVWLGVPLRTPTEIIGVLVVQHYEDPNIYAAPDAELLSSVADQIAVVIDADAPRKPCRIRAITSTALSTPSPTRFSLKIAATNGRLSTTRCVVLWDASAKNCSVNRITIFFRLRKPTVSGKKTSWCLPRSGKTSTKNNLPVLKASRAPS